MLDNPLKTRNDEAPYFQVMKDLAEIEARIACLRPYQRAKIKDYQLNLIRLRGNELNVVKGPTT